MADTDGMTYKGGYSKLIPQRGKQAGHYEGMDGVLDTLAAEGLDALAERITAHPGDFNPRPVTAPEKLTQLSAELAGQPMLVTLHALTIAASRRKDPPAIAQRLFLEIWRSKAAVVMPYLDTRWALSALLTFRVFGDTEIQRRTSAELDVLFSMMKLYESERLYSGFEADKPFRIRRHIKSILPMKMEPYALGGGDLDRNLLGRLWLDAEEDPVLRPLACRLLTQLNMEKRSVFRRLNVMKMLRREKREQRALRGT